MILQISGDTRTSRISHANSRYRHWPAVRLVSNMGRCCSPPSRNALVICILLFTCSSFVVINDLRAYSTIPFSPVTQLIFFAFFTSFHIVFPSSCPLYPFTSQLPLSPTRICIQYLCILPFFVLQLLSCLLQSLLNLAHTRLVVLDNLLQLHVLPHHLRPRLLLYN